MKLSVENWAIILLVFSASEAGDVFATVSVDVSGDLSTRLLRPEDELVLRLSRGSGSDSIVGTGVFVGVVTRLPPSASDLEDLLEDSFKDPNSSSSPIVSLELRLELWPNELSNFSKRVSRELLLMVDNESWEE